jgi:predicted nucleic acid-binding protein
MAGLQAATVGCIKTFLETPDFCPEFAEKCAERSRRRSIASPSPVVAWYRLFDVIQVWPILDSDGRAAGEAIYGLARQGFQASLPDAIIAAVARRAGATIVTDNVRGFERLGARCLRPPG